MKKYIKKTLIYIMKYVGGASAQPLSTRLNFLQETFVIRRAYDFGPHSNVL